MFTRKLILQDGGGDFPHAQSTDMAALLLALAASNTAPAASFFSLAALEMNGVTATPFASLAGNVTMVVNTATF